MSTPPPSSSSPLSPQSRDPVDEESLKLFPERRRFSNSSPSWLTSLFGRQAVNTIKCEKRIEKVINESPLVKLMVAALRSAGCPIDVRRHISCEWCGKEVTGGYDPYLNQIVVCYNQCSSYACTETSVGHELLHMFDACRANLDFNNVEHVACTEIRAANLFHCSIMSGWVADSVSFTNLAQAHARCVKQKALASILAVRPEMDRVDGRKVIDKVFDKCYNDLEPIGRRVRRQSFDRERAYRERYLYGYY